MKRVKQLLFLLALFFFISSADVLTQEQTSQQQFPLGAFLGGGHKTDPLLYQSVSESGMKWVSQYADENTKGLLQDFNLIAMNQANAQDYIAFYATCYYSKWESESVQTDKDKVGVKHRGGQYSVWDFKPCWSSIGVSALQDSLVYGPHYRQEKYYKRWYNDLTPVYRTRFNMALDYTPETVNPNENVCVIKVVYRYAEVYYSSGNYDSLTMHDTVFVQDTLKISDFNANGLFKYFELPLYQYPSKFGYGPINEKAFGLLDDDVDTLYSDSDGDNGIQFCVDWLRDDNLCTLYIDCAEVYDEPGWDEYIQNRPNVITNISTYLQPYSDSDWPNLKYWYSHDEPYTQDAYTPMHIVDSLVQSFGGSPVLSYFYPSWRINVNGDPHLEKYYNMVQPEKLWIDYYPMSAEFDVLRSEDLEALRIQLQLAQSKQLMEGR